MRVTFTYVVFCKYHKICFSCSEGFDFETNCFLAKEVFIFQLKDFNYLHRYDYQRCFSPWKKYLRRQNPSGCRIGLLYCESWTELASQWGTPSTYPHFMSFLLGGYLWCCTAFRKVQGCASELQYIYVSRSHSESMERSNTYSLPAATLKVCITGFWTQKLLGSVKRFSLGVKCTSLSLCHVRYHIQLLQHMAEWQYLNRKQISYSCTTSSNVLFLAGKNVLLEVIILHNTCVEGRCTLGLVSFYST